FEPSLTVFPCTTLFRSYLDGSRACCAAARGKGWWGRKLHSGVGRPHGRGCWTVEPGSLTPGETSSAGRHAEAVGPAAASSTTDRSEEHTSELQSRGHLV